MHCARSWRSAWGFDEDVPDVCYEFRVEPSARENLAEFADLSESWHSYLGGGPALRSTTTPTTCMFVPASMPITFALCRRLPQGAYLLADFGGGEGQVFNYVDSLNDRELEILLTFLVQRNPRTRRDL